MRPTYEQAIASSQAFWAAHGSRLRDVVNRTILRSGRAKPILVSYDVWCECVRGLQFWPYRDEHGEPYVGSAMFVGDDHREHVLFKGVPLIPWQPYTLPPELRA